MPVTDILPARTIRTQSSTKMALKLRKDIQKASYYVWFLGAEEARGLRGPRILLPAIPHLIERSREHEPLKVTLQVSQKGIKIIQGSSKHFITHSAITCSVQADDIVACVLLLYNPTTKCPLHIHAYRCDSEATAAALHQFLQVLINRPENQKRFTELEARLGLQTSTPSARALSSSSPHDVPLKRSEMSPRPFESSLGSDTGTSNRESECSEEHVPTQPLTAPKSSLYDSLAAELRAKLNGNGPPLLLPPRDYDTVHRSKGNLAATELRRCRNKLIVGGPTKQSIATIRSRGSSGIGSDLAPSPERQDGGHSSSDDDWVQPSHTEPLKMQPQHRKPIQRSFAKTPTHIEPLPDHVEPTPAFMYPFTKEREPLHAAPAPPPIVHKRLSYSSSFDNNKEPLHRSASIEEQKIKPTMIRPRNYEAPFKHILDERQYSDELEQNDDRNEDVDDDPDIVTGKYLQAKQRLERKYRRSAGVKESKYYDDEEPSRAAAVPDYRYVEKGVRKSIEPPLRSPAPKDMHFSDRNEEPPPFDYRENLTDKQKFREALIDKQERLKGRLRDRSADDDFCDHKYNDRRGYREEPQLEKPRMLPTAKTRYERSPEKPVYKMEPPINDHSGAYRSRKHDGNYKNDRPDTLDFDTHPMLRNPYKEPDSLPYRESIEKMIKSPVMRYKSFDESNSYSDEESNDEHKGGQLSKYLEQHHDKTMNKTRRPYASKEPVSPNKYERPSRSSPMMMMMATSRRYDDKKHTAYHSSDGASVSTTKVSPKDRFQDAKQKFQAMELDRNASPQRDKSAGGGYSPQQRRPTQQRQSSYDRSRHHSDWTFDDGSSSPPPPPAPQLPSIGSHKRMQQQHPSEYHHDVPAPTMQSSDRYMDNGKPDSSHQHNHQSRALGPAKSLGNLVKGYRHSYADPHHNAPMPRNSGRVGLAAVNPF